MISVSDIVWSEKKINLNLVEKMNQDKNFSQILSKLVVSRNFSDEEILTISNHEKVSFSNVFRNENDFNDAIKIIIETIKNKEKICIFGDYDVDGSCSTSLLYKFFISINHPTFFFIPDREKDGYGPSEQSFKKIISKLPKLVIMVDCGSNANKAIDFLNSNNIKSIIIDHHQINKPYPKANKIINPKKNSTYSKYDYICATTLTYFLLELILKKVKSNFVLRDYLIYVLLATVCDVMPLRGINRNIALNCLNNFNLEKIYPIKKICEILNKNSKLNINDLGYLIGPIINAGGRLGKSEYAVHLLSSDNENEIDILSKKMIDLNNKRKIYEREIIDKIDFNKITKQSDNMIIYYDPTINEGLIGIVSARLKDKFNKPTIVLTKSKNILKGSARSIYGFDIGIAINNAKNDNLIINGGGHKMAAGFTLKDINLSEFKRFMNNSYKKFFLSLKEKNIHYYESKISPNTLKIICNEIDKLNPFGNGNPEPLFLFQRLKISKIKVLDKKHISNLFISKEGFSVMSICFNSVNEKIGKYLLNYKKEVNVIGYVKENFWNNKKTLQLVIRDLII